MIKSIAVTFISATKEHTRVEADALFDSLFGKGKYAVGGVEVTPYELAEELREVVQEDGSRVYVRDTLSWQGTYAAHPIA